MRLVWTLGSLLLLTAAGWSQEVEIGGRLDLELRSDRDVTVDFGRHAGLDLTCRLPGKLDAYADLSVAGGRVRLQELYCQLPQTRRVVEVTLGRFLLPHGDPRLDPADRYAPGAPDLFDSYRGWRRGNVLLDTELTGLRLTRVWGPLTADLCGGSSSAGELALQGRLQLGDRGWRGGLSGFQGRLDDGSLLRQVVLHGGYSGARWQANGQLYLGRAAGNDQRGWAARLGWRVPGAPVDLFAAQTLYNDDRRSAVKATRLGARWKLDSHWRAELRYEFHQAPAPDHDNRLVLRAEAIF
ncbi:MAG: hypothetical protein IT204_07265 [Fimbriimonadaceae bacterium]|nr:hypothetical protein [Fimbriimonadaceae bacterium]